MPIYEEYGDKDAYKGQAILDEVLDAIVEQGVEVFDVVGEAGDDPANLLLGVELKAQGLQMTEQRVPQVQDHVLSDPTHPKRLHIRKDPGQHVDEGVGCHHHIDDRKSTRYEPLIYRVSDYKRLREARRRDQNGNDRQTDEPRLVWSGERDEP